MVNMAENVLLRRGDDSRAHVLPMPLWLGIIRIAQFVLSLLVMILSAYAASTIGGIFAGYGLSFFIFAWTILFLAYVIAIPLYYPRLYVYWLHFILEFKTTVFWLATFALLAEEAAVWGTYYGVWDESYPVYNSDGTISYVNVLPGGKGASIATKVAAAFGAFTWLLFVASFITVAIASYNHYRNKGPIFANSTAAPANEIEKGNAAAQQSVELNEVQPTPQPIAQQHI